MVANLLSRWSDRVAPLHRGVLLGVAAAGMTLGGCGWQQARFQQAATLSAPHVAATGLNVRTRNGSVLVRKAGTTDGQVSITATLKMVTRERLGQATILANRNAAGVLEISATPPEGGWRSNEGCSFDITVPDASGVDLSTGNGRIEITGLSGKAKLDTSNGRITIDGHAGPVEADTSNGAIEADGVEGEIDARTSNGKVRIAMGAGSTGPVKIQTSNGSVTLELSAAFRGELDASTSNGSVVVPSNSPAGVSKFFSKSNGRKAQLVIGDGGPSSSIRTSNGSIVVKFAD